MDSLGQNGQHAQNARSLIGLDFIEERHTPRLLSHVGVDSFELHRGVQVAREDRSEKSQRIVWRGESALFGGGEKVHYLKGGAVQGRQVPLWQTTAAAASLSLRLVRPACHT